MTRGVWQLAPGEARLTGPRMTARIDLTRPAAGLVDVIAADVPLSGARLLGVCDPRMAAEGTTLPADAYVRGNDLVVVYEETADRPVRIQVYWRWLGDEGPAAGVELIVSAQTSLLESDPELTVVSEIPTGEVHLPADGRAAQVSRSVRPPWSVVRLEEGRYEAAEPGEPATAGPFLFLFRPREHPLSYLEVVHPSDFAGAAFTTLSDGAVQATYSLFEQRLEKGVIRRARVRGLLLSRATDAALACDEAAAFARSTPPLTA